MEKEENNRPNDEGEKNKQKTWSEEFQVAGEELVETVKKLVSEAGVRRIVIKNRKGRVLLRIPLLLGMAGIIWLPVYSSLALVAALVAECSVIVERTKPTAE